MAFQVSPGVEVKEVDLTNVIPAVSTSIGAFAGHFSWGPVGEVKLVSSEKELIKEYGAPVDTTTGGDYDNYTSFLQAASFLKYSNTLRISRACATTAKNAAGSRNGAATDVVTINNKDAFEGLTTFSPSGGTKPGVVQARYPGKAGNSLKLQIATAVLNSGNFTDSGLNGMVNASAGTSAWAASNAALGATSATPAVANDEVHIAVIDEDGSFSGVAGTVLEIFEGVSLYSDAVKDGGVNYYKTIINRDSEYVYINEAALVSSGFNSSAVGGVTYAVPGNAASSGKLFDALGLKASSEVATVTSGVTAFTSPNDILEGTYTISSEDGGVTGTKLGAGATFTVVISGAPSAWAATVTVISGGYGFAVGETIVIPETLLGGSTDSNDPDETVTITVATLNAANGALFDYSLVKGVDGSTAVTAAAPGDVVTALTQFANPEAVDINLLFAESDADGATIIGTKIVGICGTDRKDCVGFISPHPTADETDDVTKSDGTGDLDSYNNSYVVLDSSAVYVYNKYNDSYRYIPANGHVAGLCARTDDTNDPWFSPAGYNRGNLLGVAKLKWNPNKAQRDTLYKAGVNPIISEPGQGIVLFGDKTAQSKPSAFDRINVRRLFIVLEKAISTASKYQLFELNDEFTRAMFRNMTEPFLRDVKGRRGITDFLVVCDETNNTGDVIDTNRFVADIYIKPARSINFITLNFVATRTGVEFSEIVGTGN